MLKPRQAAAKFAALKSAEFTTVVKLRYIDELAADHRELHKELRRLKTANRGQLRGRIGHHETKKGKR